MSLPQNIPDLRRGARNTVDTLRNQCMFWKSKPTPSLFLLFYICFLHFVSSMFFNLFLLFLLLFLQLFYLLLFFVLFKFFKQIGGINRLPGLLSTGEQVVERVYMFFQPFVCFSTFSNFFIFYTLLLHMLLYCFSVFLFFCFC